MKQYEIVGHENITCPETLAMIESVLAGINSGESKGIILPSTLNIIEKGDVST